MQMDIQRYAMADIQIYGTELYPLIAILLSIQNNMYTEDNSLKRMSKI